MRLVLDIDVGADPLSGRLIDGEHVVAFSGVLDLLAVLSSVQAGGALPRVPSVEE